MTRFSRTFAATVAALCLGLPAQSQAQDWIGPSPMDLGWQHSNQLGLMMQQQHFDNIRDSDGEEEPEPEAAKQPPVSLTYEPSMLRRKNNLASFIAKTRKVDPVGAQQLQQLTESMDIFGAIGAAIAPFGLRTDNVADAYSLWWINAWTAYAGDYTQTDPAVLKAVKSQVEDIMQVMPEMRAATDADRQQFAEALLIQAALVDAATETAKTDPDYAAQLTVASAQAGKGMGLDFRKMTLTRNGFEMR